MPASQWISILRNALAHGGIAYLNKEEKSNHEQPVKMFAFVCCKYGAGECPAGLGNLEGLNILRISEYHFQCFFGNWVDWMRANDISK